MAKPPALPAIRYDVLPGEGWIQGTHKLLRQVIIFDTWKLGRLRLAGTRVTMLLGLCEVAKHDVVNATSSVPQFRLNPGDNFFRYTYRGEGFAFLVKAYFAIDLRHRPLSFTSVLSNVGAKRGAGSLKGESYIFRIPINAILRFLGSML